ncbi:hypothetical protein HGRIS_012618 [Hohenbuehelia grisea]|uniref:Peptidase A1 domain-containing protein n=1 Tax=Hohenbuehelia grisea TaxID=104357 RepID=A0ABR3ISY5_9AGAR
MLHLCSFVVLALALSLHGAATPVVTIRDTQITLPVIRRLNLTAGRDMLNHGQARVQALHRHAAEIASGKATQRNAIHPIPASDQAVTSVVSVGVGSPPTYYDLIIDTGSSNTWIGAGTPYVHTKTSIETRNEVSVGYGSGYFEGREYLDQVSLGKHLTIHNQSIGVSDFSIGFQGYDGILGIGPVGLTRYTLYPDYLQLIPTVTDNLFSQQTISSRVVGVSYTPFFTPEGNDGEISFGGPNINSRKLIPPIHYVPTTTVYPASAYWGIDQSVTYGANTPILHSSSGIVDTGESVSVLYFYHRSFDLERQEPRSSSLPLTLMQDISLLLAQCLTLISDCCASTRRNLLD